MSRKYATIAITALAVVLLVDIYDYIIPPYSGVIPVVVEKLAIAILAGVAIAAIITSMKPEEKAEPKAEPGEDE